MTGEPFPPRPPVVEPSSSAEALPATVVAALVLVLVHALLLIGGTVASGYLLAAFAVTHPGFGWSPSVLVPGVLGNLLTLVLAAGDVLLGLRLWQRARRARVLLSGWLGLSAVVTLGGVVTSFTQVATPSVPFVTLWVVELGLCAATVVLVWRPASSAWLRSRSVGPARPGL
jgi:hypothetical protein